MLRNFFYVWLLVSCLNHVSFASSNDNKCNNNKNKKCHFTTSTTNDKWVKIATCVDKNTSSSYGCGEFNSSVLYFCEQSETVPATYYMKRKDVSEDNINEARNFLEKINGMSFVCDYAYPNCYYRKDYPAFESTELCGS